MTELPPRLTRYPAMLPCIAFGVGIAVDSSGYLPSASRSLFPVVFIVLAAIGVATRRIPPTLVATFLLIGIALAGAVRHHVFWDVRPMNHISRFVGDDSHIVRIRARLTTNPQIQQPEESIFSVAWKQDSYTTAIVECLSWNDESPVEGLAELFISGEWDRARAGDEIEILGHAQRPPRSRNPGELDLRTFLKRRGIEVRIRSDDPRQVIPKQRGAVWSEVFARLQRSLHDILRKYVDPEQQGIAVALLLGIRGDLSEETKLNFQRSGTFHLLAISGLHVGMIAAMMGGILRLFQLAPKTRTILLIGFLAGYACVTELRPSVVRATVLISLYLFGQQTGRIVRPINLLFATALLLLIFRPAELFSPGAQLSFLAVLGILLIRPFLQQIEQSRSLLERVSAGLEVPLHRRIRWKSWRTLKLGIALGIGAWILTFPIIAIHFQQIPLWGIPMTLLLIPFVAISVGTGLLLLVFGLLVPIAAPVCGVLLSATLASLQGIVSASSRLPIDVVQVAPPSIVWGVTYALAVFVVIRGTGRVRQIAIFAWFVCLLHPFVVPSEAQLGTDARITFLAVGHGLCVLIESPSGETHLYDAGSSDGGIRAGRVLQSVLRHRGIRRLDSIVLSHADLDHYSAVPALIRQFEVGTIQTSPQALASTEPNFLRLLEELVAAEIPIHPVSAGDQLDWADIECRVRHPQLRESYSSDNAASIVLSLEYANRRILLTGDIEAEGQVALMRSASTSYDIVLSPHHGSFNSNTPDWANWAQAQHVVISSNDSDQLLSLTDIHSRAVSIDSTARVGAMTFTITSEGTFKREFHLHSP